MRAFRSRAGWRSGAAARCGMTRWPGAMPAAADLRGVDLIQNCEVTGMKIEGGRIQAAWKPPRLHRRGQGRRGGGGQFVVEGHGPCRHAAADRKPCAAGLCLRGAEAADRRRDDLWRRAFLCQPVRQGRPRFRRRHRRLQFLRPTRQPAGDRGRGRRRHGADARHRARPPAAHLGRHHGHVDGRQSPIIDKTHVEGLYFNGGWCYGGFKATPASGWCFAHLLANDAPHKVATAYRFDRFLKGLMIDEKGQGAQPNLH
jgi:hypothetical protein